MNVATAQTEQGPGQVEQLRVLVVDDDPYIVKVIGRLLEGEGITDVRSAVEGSAALRQLGTRPADVVVADVNMPGMDGLELLRHLTREHEPPAVILVSAEDERVLQTAHQLGQAHDLRILGALGKPIRQTAIRGLLELAVAHSESSPSTPGIELTPEELRQGLEDGHVQPFFQPKVDARDGTLRGAEALARWQHPERGLTMPSAFIPVAERTGLIHELTRKMIDASLRHAGAWHRAGLEIGVAVNVSVLDVEDLVFADFLVDRALTHGVEHRFVTIEVTESRILDRLTSALETLTRLRLRGFKLSLDDYGTGASTLDHLRRLPVNEMKIDRAFVDGAAHDPKLRTMLTSTVALSRELGLSTVAEGIERDEDLELVASLGVDQAQGYLVCRPCSPQDFLDWAGSRSP